MGLEEELLDWGVVGLEEELLDVGVEPPEG